MGGLQMLMAFIHNIDEILTALACTSTWHLSTSVFLGRKVVSFSYPYGFQSLPGFLHGNRG